MIPKPISPSDLAALRGKYERMLGLRERHDTGTEGRGVTGEMRRLADEFPGALREIDELPLDEIRARIAAIAAAEADRARVAPWMTATHLFHTLTRGALCAKKWLAGRKQVGAAEREAFARESAALCWAEDARAWGDELGKIAAPPRGRVTELVFERIASDMDASESEARQLVFGFSRKMGRTQA